MRRWWLPAVLATSLALPARAGADPAAQEQVITFQVLQPAGITLQGAWIDLTRLGETRRVTLSDDGGRPGDIPYDGVWLGEDRGDFARIVDATVLVALPDAQPRPLITEAVRTDAAWAATVSWRLMESPEGVSAQRATFAHPGRSESVSDLMPLAGTFGWLVFLAVFVVGLLLVLQGEPDR